MASDLQPPSKSYCVKCLFGDDGNCDEFLSSCETQTEISDSVFDFYEYGTITSDEEYPMTYDTLCVDHTTFNDEDDLHIINNSCSEDEPAELLNYDSDCDPES